MFCCTFQFSFDCGDPSKIQCFMYVFLQKQHAALKYFNTAWNGNKDEWIKQTPCVSKIGACARNTNHIDRLAQSTNLVDINRPFNQLRTPTIRSVNGNSNSRESKNTTRTEETKREKKQNRDTKNAVLFPSLTIEGASSECLKANVSLRTVMI